MEQIINQVHLSWIFSFKYKTGNGNGREIKALQLKKGAKTFDQTTFGCMHLKYIVDHLIGEVIRVINISVKISDTYLRLIYT
jgi:hypothetical protein